MTSRITRITDAPLPTPSPWEGAPAAVRCPACALPEPGERSCRGCGAALTARVGRRAPMSVSLVNLAVILVGRGPLLLAIAFLLRPDGAPLVTPWTAWLAGVTPVLWLAGCGLFLRWRWAWFLALAAALVDLLAAVALQVARPGNPLIPVAVVATDLMAIGLLLLVYDEVRVARAPIGPPEEHAWPKTPVALYDAGVAYSRAGHWYLAALMWQRAVALRHHEGLYRRALALAYVRLRELGAAEAELAAARALLPGDEQTARLGAALAELRGAAR